MAGRTPRIFFWPFRNEKLNIGVIGVANRASANLGGIKGENVVALCDIDEGYLLRAAVRHPRARVYRDFRKLLEQPGLDAVMIARLIIPMR